MTYKKEPFLKRTLKMNITLIFFRQNQKSLHLSNFLKQKLNHILPWTADDFGFLDGMAPGRSLFVALLRSSGEKWSEHNTLHFFGIQEEGWPVNFAHTTLRSFFGNEKKILSWKVLLFLQAITLQYLMLIHHRAHCLPTQLCNFPTLWALNFPSDINS